MARLASSAPPGDICQGDAPTAPKQNGNPPVRGGPGEAVVRMAQKRGQKCRASGRRIGGGERPPPDQGNYIAGSSTVSITWITPFDCLTSAMVTLAILP